MAEHMAKGTVVFGVNHTIRNFKTGKKKNLDPGNLYTRHRRRGQHDELSIR